jgi:prepilin-type N-terminal cleavage/methylation domain-containing protein
MKTNSIHKRGFTLVELLVVIVIIASLAALSAPMIMGQVKKAARTEAISNAKQIGLAMFQFENDYGSYPDADTLDRLTTDLPDADVQGGTGNANEYFRQLMHAGIAPSEEMFYAKAEGTIKPDGDITGTKALDTGEVGFGYITNGAEGMSTSGNPSRVLVVSPLANGGGDYEFDAGPFDGVAVLLKIDQSVSAPKISKDEETGLGPVKIGTVELDQAKFWGSVAPQMNKPEIE